jgi:outer membrane protein assembly factor BamE (lipoprotein component of BamABCDE complex)
MEGGNMKTKTLWNGFWFLALGVAGLFLLSSTGCSVYMAAKQPSEKNMDVMNVGTSRSLVLAEFGQPTASETKDGKKVDVFSFVQGYSKGAKTGRAVFHGVADFFTLGLWEVVGTPTEAIFDGTKVTYEITYDEGNRVENVVALTEKSKEEAPNLATQPAPKPTVEAEK